MKAPQDQQKAIVDEFSKFNNWEARYRHLIKRGKSLADLPDELKTEKYKVKGCQSQVWLIPELRDNKVVFQADSDALLVRGLVSLLLDVYSGRTPQEILVCKPDFLEAIGLTRHLSASRTNGLAAMIKQIQMYAAAFHYQLQQQSQA